MSAALGPRSRFDCTPHRAAVAALCSRLAARRDRNGERFVLEARLAGDALPAPLRAALAAFHARGNRDGCLLIRGLPFDSQAGAERCLALVASRLGELAGYAQEKHGALFHPVAPERAQAFEQSAAGSRVPLALHTERCFHPWLPSHVLLACVRPDRAGAALTQVASVRRLLARLPARARAQLFRTAYRTGIDYSFGNRATRKANGPVLAVLYGNRGDPFLRYDLDLMAGLDAPAAAALGALAGAAQRETISLPLAAGDLLVIDNRRAVHGRGAFEPRYDGRDRLLVRAYVLADLAAAAADMRPGERVIRTRFR